MSEAGKRFWLDFCYSPYENDLTRRSNPEIDSDEAFDTAPPRCVNESSAVRRTELDYSTEKMTG